MPYKNKKQVMQEFAAHVAQMPFPPTEPVARRLSWDGYLHILEMRKEIKRNSNWTNTEYVSGKPKRVRSPKPIMYPLSVVKAAFDYGRGYQALHEDLVVKTELDVFEAFHLPKIVQQ